MKKCYAAVVTASVLGAFSTMASANSCTEQKLNNIEQTFTQSIQQCNHLYLNDTHYFFQDFEDFYKCESTAKKVKENAQIKALMNEDICEEGKSDA